VVQYSFCPWHSNKCGTYTPYLIAESSHAQSIKLGRLAFEASSQIDPRFFNQTLSDIEADALAEKDPGLVRREGNVCWFELKVSDYLKTEVY